MAWLVVEEFVEGKSDRIVCEDVIVVTADFAAVVDGASDQTGRRFGGQSGGRFAAETLQSAILSLNSQASAREFADQLSDRLLRAVAATVGDLDSSARWPAASVICLSLFRNEIWRVGDCSFLIDGQPNLGSKRVDDAAYGFRAAINSALLASGTSLTEILRDDPGAAAARPLIDLQQQLSNREGPWGFGCVNGRPVPDQFVEVFPLAQNATEIVLTSDGFPDPRPSLVESESRLRNLLEMDPAAIGDLWTVGKSLRPGANSVDDRAYLRLRNEPS